MSDVSIAAEAENRSRLQGFALVTVIIALMLTTLLEALDQAIVGTAMPRIIAQLHGLDRYTWVVTAYILASTTMIPIVGKLSDQFGRKWFLIAGTLLFLLGSLLSGASQSMNQLIFFRALQGLGAGIGIALVATVFGDLFPPAERAKWMGVFGMVYGVSSLFGPTLGGWLAEHGPLLGNLVTESSRWRWVFYINLPVGILAVAALQIFLPAHLSVNTNEWTGRAAFKRIDFLGALLSAAATCGLMLGLTLGSSGLATWTSPQVVGLLAAGVVLLVLFLVNEQRAAEPILPLNLFRSQVFSAASLLSLLQMMVVLGLTLYLPLYLQGVLGISPTDAGLVMTPLSLSMVLGAMLAGPIVGAFKRYQLVTLVGAVFMVVGMVLVALMTPTTSVAQAIAFTILLGVGTGVFFTTPTLAAQNALPASQLGVGTAATRYLGQVGATLGIAIVGTVVASAASASLLQQLPSTQAGKVALAGALQHGFIAVLVFSIIALITTFFLKDLPFAAPVKNEGAEEVREKLEEAELIS